MEEAHSKDDLPPVPAEGVLFEEVVGDLGEGSPDVGSQTFGRFIRHLVACGRDRQEMQSLTNNPGSKSTKTKVQSLFTLTEFWSTVTGKTFVGMELRNKRKSSWINVSAEDQRAKLARY